MSTRFRVGDDFAGCEYRNDRSAKKARQFFRNLLQGPLPKSDAIDLHGAVGSDQIIGGHVSDAVFVRSRIAVIIEESREGDAIFRAEVARVARVILRAGPERRALGSVGREKACEKGKCELTNR